VEGLKESKTQRTIECPSFRCHQWCDCCSPRIFWRTSATCFGSRPPSRISLRVIWRARFYQLSWRNLLSTVSRNSF